MQVAAVLLAIFLGFQANPEPATLQLTNGDQLRGTVTLLANGEVRLTHDLLGPVSFPASIIKDGTVTIRDNTGSVITGEFQGYADGMWSIQPSGAAVIKLVVQPDGGLQRVREQPAPTEKDQHETVSEKDLKEQKEEARDRIKAAKKIISDAEKTLDQGWRTTLSLGGNVSRGTADAASVSFNVGVKRNVGDAKTALTMFYLLNTQNGETSQNWFQIAGTHSWKIPSWSKKISLFAESVFDWQEQASWEQRVNGNLGIGYQLIDLSRPSGTDWFQKMKFQARVAPGFRKEFAGINTDWVPEVLLGGVWDLKFLEDLSWSGNAQAFPDLLNFGEVRVTANTNLKFALDSIEGMSLGVGLRFQYQSEVAPGDANYLLVVEGLVSYEF